MVSTNLQGNVELTQKSFNAFGSIWSINRTSFGHVSSRRALLGAMLSSRILQHNHSQSRSSSFFWQISLVGRFPYNTFTISNRRVSITSSGARSFIYSIYFVYGKREYFCSKICRSIIRCLVSVEQSSKLTHPLLLLTKRIDLLTLRAE